MPLIEEELTRSVIGAFYEVYNTLGFGFLEHVYCAALERELRSRGHRVAREVGITVWYKGEELVQQRMDMIINERLILEIKSPHRLPVHAPRQLINYLKATKLEVGLLLYFGPEASFYRLVFTNARKPLITAYRSVDGTPGNSGPDRGSAT